MIIIRKNNQVDKIEKYIGFIKEICYKYEKMKYANGEIYNHILLDDERQSYIVVSIGWDGSVYAHSAVFHISIINNKVWLHQDWTEMGIPCELEEKGIPKSDIVIGYQPEHFRKHMEYAVN